MNVARIVFARRSPRELPSFEYLVPDGWSIKIGQLVQVPWRQATAQGVVWDLSRSATQPRLKTVTKIIKPEPIISLWQHHALRTLCDRSFVSPGHVVRMILPSLPKRLTSLDLSDYGQYDQATPVGSYPAGTTWWYRQRTEAVSWLINWLVSEPSSIRLVIVPTREDGLQIISAAQGNGLHLPLVDSHLQGRKYYNFYEAVRRGQCRTVIGTARALFLPYPQSPQVIIDQEEHPAHKHSDQQPRFDPRTIINEIVADIRITTSSPSVRWYQRNKPPIPAGHYRRQVYDLNRPHQLLWVNDEVLEIIRQPIKRAGLIIIPQSDSARSIICRDCHHARRCGHCQRVAIIKRTKNGRWQCRFCQTPLEAIRDCPQCHGVNLDYQGLSADKINNILNSAIKPPPLIATTEIKQARAIYLSDYNLPVWLRSVPDLDWVIFIHGDAMLNVPDFSTAERAWGFLSRGQAYWPKTPFIVQTFHPDQDFWQNWQAGRTAAWYEAEINERRRLRLPPEFVHWILRYPGQDAKLIVRKKYDQLMSLGWPNVTIEILPLIQVSINRTPVGRLLVRSTSAQPPTPPQPWSSLFPSPWQIDPDVTSWLN